MAWRRPSAPCIRTWFRFVCVCLGLLTRTAVARMGAHLPGLTELLLFKGALSKQAAIQGAGLPYRNGAGDTVQPIPSPVLRLRFCPGVHPSLAWMEKQVHLHAALKRPPGRKAWGQHCRRRRGGASGVTLDGARRTASSQRACLTSLHPQWAAHMPPFLGSSRPLRVAPPTGGHVRAPGNAPANNIGSDGAQALTASCVLQPRGQAASVPCGTLLCPCVCPLLTPPAPSQ